jgi:DNA primase
MSQEVANLLTKNNITYVPSGKDFLIKCLNPEHEDNNPSCRVNRLTGITHCFSCGWSANIFRKFGVLTDSVALKTAKLKAKLQELAVANKDIEAIDGHTPLTEEYRGISVATYRAFGTFVTNRHEKLKDRVVFPITDITGKTVVYVGRQRHSNVEPRYLMYPSGITVPLFPAVLPKEYNSMILVEGIFDMLNLYEHGIKNAVCTFGTNTLTENNIAEKMLAYKTSGIIKVFIMFDGDDPGRDAARKLQPLLENLSFTVELINIAEDTDPGNTDPETLRKIKEYTI